MKKILITAILVNTLILLTLSNIAKAHHKSQSHKFNGVSFSAPGSKDYQKLETELVENDTTALADKQLKNNEKTGLISYIVYEDGKIKVNKKNWTQEVEKNNGLLRSNSVGKSLISYVTGHAVCEYGINLNTKLNDWVVINDTVYEDNNLLQVLNMTSGDHRMIGEYKFKSDGYVKDDKSKHINSKTVAWSMKWFRGTSKKKENAPYNYSAMSTHVAINYVIHKVGYDNYEKLLEQIFTDHVGVKNDVHFNKVSWSKADADYGVSRYTFFATAEDYLRIANTIIKDFNSDTCIGDYLRSIYDNRVKKRDKLETKAVAQYTKEYGGQFHLTVKGLEDKIIFAMDGAGGQQVIMNMETGQVIVVNTDDQHYNWKKLVYNVMKKGL